MYSLLCSWDNLLLAYRKASKGKRGQPNVAAFEYRLEDNLLHLQRQLLEKAYQPGKYHSFHIHDPKKRLISAAPFRDRVVHHALCNLIEPIFERSLIFDSYANRIGKGTHRALHRATQFARRFKYVLPCDIRQFFPSIDHAILRRILARKVDDPGVLWLIDQILASGVGVLSEEYEMVYFAGDDPSTGSGQGLFAANRPRGLPIGNLTSQFWAWPRPVNEGFPFLGFTIYPTHRRLKRRRGIAFARRLRRLREDYAGNRIPFERLDASLKGWVNYVHHGDTWGLRRSLLTEHTDH